MIYALSTRYPGCVSEIVVESNDRMIRSAVEFVFIDLYGHTVREIDVVIFRWFVAASCRMDISTWTFTEKALLLRIKTHHRAILPLDIRCGRRPEVITGCASVDQLQHESRF